MQKCLLRRSPKPYLCHAILRIALYPKVTLKYSKVTLKFYRKALARMQMSILKIAEPQPLRDARITNAP